MAVDQMKGLFQGLDISASGMSAELMRARVVASNLSNMHVTGGNGAEPYRRKAVVFEELLASADDGTEVNSGQQLAGGVKISQVYEDRVTPFIPRYEPGHPHADERGFVLSSNVDVFREMVDMMSIERGFQANLAAMESYKKMLRNTVDNMRT